MAETATAPLTGKALLQKIKIGNHEIEYGHHILRCQLSFKRGNRYRPDTLQVSGNRFVPLSYTQ